MVSATHPPLREPFGETSATRTDCKVTNFFRIANFNGQKRTFLFIRPGNLPVMSKRGRSRLSQRSMMCFPIWQKRFTARVGAESGAGEQKRPSVLTDRGSGAVCEHNRPPAHTGQAKGGGGGGAVVVRRGAVVRGRNSAFSESGAGGKARARSGLTASVRALVRTAPRD